jgi:hypothetical protein
VGTLKNVRDTDKVHDYLRANNMEKFIPKKFQTNTKFLIKITANFIFFVDYQSIFIGCKERAQF